MAWALCENPPKPGRCGMVWDELVRQGKIAAFVKDECHEDLSGEVSDECRARFSELFVDLLRRTYTRAVEMDIFKFCESQPDKCGTKDLVELQWITSHDAHVLSFYGALMDAEVQQHAASQQAAADARRAQAQAEANAAASRQAAARVLHAVGAGLQGASQGLQQNRRVNCTSNRVGQTVFTNCQ